jgi:hypothetical protein
MAREKVPLEKGYYPVVATWLKRHFTFSNWNSREGARVF